MRKITEIIIHCTATPANWRDGQQTSAKVAEVKLWHTSPPRNWSDIGYHYLIDRDGTIASGRPMIRDGAHVRGHNRGTIGIALFGGHGSSENDKFEEHFTPEQDAALRQLIADLRADFGNVKLSGHNEYAAKACPGFKVRQWFDRKPPRKLINSTTLQAVGASGVGVAGTAVGALHPNAQILLIGGLLVITLGLLWIARERVKKFVRGVR